MYSAMLINWAIEHNVPFADIQLASCENAEDCAGIPTVSSDEGHDEDAGA